MATNGKLEARITVPTGGWDIALTDQSGGPTTITIPAGTYYHSSAGSGSNDFTAEIMSLANAAMGQSWSCTVSAGEGGTGRSNIYCTGTTCTVTFTDTEVRDILGFTGNLSGSTSYTSQGHVEGLWLPDHGYQTLNGGGSWKGVPISDKQDRVNANGNYFGVRGSKRYELEITWPMVSRNKVWADNETFTNESFQTFMLDGIQGEATWADVGGPVRWYPDADTDGTYNTYSVPGFQEWRPEQVREMWLDQWRVLMPRMVEVPT